MGALDNRQTHEERSSNLSFALRWKHENLRLISTISIISCAMTFMFLVMLYGTATKSVSVVVNGQEQVVKTKQLVLQRLLDEQAISIGEHDLVNIPLNGKIQDGQRITIDRGKPVQLTADGKTTTVYTTGTTVESALRNLHIALGKDDKVVPSPDTKLTDTSDVKIVRVKKETEQVNVPIYFGVVQQNDGNLLKGKQQVVQEGKQGVLVKQKEKVYEDGELISETIVDESVGTPSADRIVAVGTKNPVVTAAVTAAPASASAAPTSGASDTQEVSKNGMNFGYKQVLNNVSLTAYAAGVSSTGKSSSSPQYGMTATGTRVTEGRTIAVDPSVVPLGWWVYIEGLGFRRAEDTGSAVKGKIIDVYFDSEDYANRFGRKNGFTVYVVGPNKPAGN